MTLKSAPSYGITISTKQTLLWETRVVNAAIKRMVLKGNMFIPFNLKMLYPCSILITLTGLRIARMIKTYLIY